MRISFALAIGRPYGRQPTASATQTVFYNTEGRAYHPRHDYIILSAQAVQGYIIGTSGPAAHVITPADDRTGNRDWLEGEGQGATLTPVSLYASQLAKRLGILDVARVTATSFQPENPPEHTIDNSLSARCSA